MCSGVWPEALLDVGVSALVTDVVLAHIYSTSAPLSLRFLWNPPSFLPFQSRFPVSNSHLLPKRPKNKDSPKSVGLRLS